MGFRGLPLALVLSAIACGGQDPAFTEDRTSTSKMRDADATARTKEGVEPLNGARPNGVDAMGQGGGADAGGTAGGDGLSSASGGDGAGGADGTGMNTGGETLGGLGNKPGATGGDTGGMTAGGSGSGGTGGTGGTGGETGGCCSGSTGGEPPLAINFRTVEVTQGSPGKVDILWIVDTSGSMAEEQQYLGQNFNAMIGQLQQSGADFQTAVTTTDVCTESIPEDLAQRACPAEYGGSAATRLRGSFVGDNGAKVLKQGQADLVQKFTQYTAQGVDGSGFEHGMHAAQLAVQKVLGGQNEPLIRSDAFLAVIVVSDEEDDGIGLWKTDAYNGWNFAAEGLTTFKYTEDDFIAYAKGVKGEGKFSVSTITGTRKADGTMCSAPHSQPLEEGTQYIKAAQKSGGIVQSICDTNWSASLATIGLDLSAQTTQVVLQDVPDTATIKVYVNGTQSSQWTYNSGNNAVKFNAGHVPAQGSAIKVTYYKKP